MAWKGDPNNPVPNFQQQSAVVSEVKTEINRAQQMRRDNDTQKNFTIGLMDVDTAILNQVEKLQLTVVDDGNNIKVPHYYASPERWVSIQRDGYLRDYNGKMILPALVLKRTSSDKDTSLMMFNRYLQYSVLKKYSQKNQYTPFNVLVGRNVPVNDVYQVTMPDHMIFTYHFIIWTEYVEQMDKIVERFNFEEDDYWGEVKGFRFRTRIEGFQHAIEVEADDDRMVKTEFDLVVNGYLLPDIFSTLSKTTSTTQKFLTPKKIVISETVVPSGFNFNDKSNREKIRNQNYPNLPSDVVIPPPPVDASLATTQLVTSGSQG